MKVASMQQLLLAALSLLSLGGTASALQATWYVDTNAQNSGSGTPEAPFLTIQTALSNALLSNGDTILVAPGSYAEDIEFRRWVTVESMEGPETTILVPAAPNSKMVTFRQGISPSTLRGLTIQGNRYAGGNSTGVFVPYPDQAGYLENCVLLGHQRAALNEYDLFFRNCTIVDNAEGLETTISSIYLVSDSILWDNGVTFSGTRPDSPSVPGSLVDIDPQFFQPGTDFHLRPISPAIDLGEANRIDLDGSPPDAGAYPWDPSYPVGRSVCASAANSGGLPGRLTCTGSASLTDNDLAFVADQLPASQATLLIVGEDRGETPLGNGTLCIAGQTARLTLGFASPTGAVTFNVDNGSAQLSTLASPGSTLHFQAWHRDSVSPTFFNLTHSVRVTFTP